jgi:hypothetical protein
MEGSFEVGLPQPQRENTFREANSLVLTEAQAAGTAGQASSGNRFVRLYQLGGGSQGG